LILINSGRANNGHQNYRIPIAIETLTDTTEADSSTKSDP